MVHFFNVNIKQVSPISKCFQTLLKNHVPAMLTIQSTDDNMYGTCTELNA